MWIFRGLASIQQQLFSSRPHSKARTKSRTNKSSPLDVPEILEHILNHVNDKTVCLSVVRVCRSWHILQQHRIVCEVLWRSNPTPKQPWTISEEQGHRATHLYCYFQQDGQLFSGEMNWLINYLRAKAAKANARYDHAKDPVAECGSGRDGRLETSEHRSQESILDAQPLCGLAFRVFYLTCHRSPPGRFKSREIFMGHTGYLPDLLCRLPHLLELKDTHAGYYTYYMDVFYSTTSTLSLETGTLHDEPPRVWTCSRLRTLHMAIAGFNADSAVARRTFGYISRVCPRLQDTWICELMLLQPLRIYGRELAPFLNIDGGLYLCRG
ncbi:hypothetical protein BKA57DRAFT_487901 [Linnemannia elongata]|nr:hypothetical protein BKA57DRAFT_487901 [Linnemannia elongata]